jgi:chemotaxis protein methyltransferase CheR
MATVAAVQNKTTDYSYLRKLVFSLSQNVLDPSRDYLFETRLSRLLRNQGLTHIEELIQLLQIRKNPVLEKAVAEAMTINETSFFRDGRPFELMRTELLPRLIEARKHQRSLRFWSAASSSGQEGYSIAMLLRENFPLLNSWRIRIEGTDLCSEVVQRAQSGTYHRIEMNRGLPARHIVRYFDHVGEDWMVKKEIREMCNFRVANLCVPPLPFNEQFDVIFLRNVMIYFSMETRKTLLQGIHKLLAPDGILFLGASEQPVDPTLWKAILAGGTSHFTPK